MNHASLNTSALFGICVCCGSSIYGLTLTTYSVEIPRSAIGQEFWRFRVHLACFIGSFSAYWWGIRMSILVGTWWRLSNREV